MQGARGERVASVGPWGRGEIQQIERFEALSPGAWQGLEPPRRDWMVEGAFLRGTVAMVSGDGGIGKCQGRGTPVVMYDGTVRPIEEIRDGDILMGPDSKPRIVRGTTSGYGPLFRVTPVKGDSYVVNGNHVLSLKWTPRTNKVRPTHPINISVRDFLALPTQEKRHLMGWRPECLHWPARLVDISPYLMGLWLGDGSCNDTAITKPDREIAEAMQEYADANQGMSVAEHESTNGVPMFRLVRGKGRKNAFRESLRRYGVFSEKSVPHDYIENSEQVRLELLAGLLDTDGHLVNGCYEIAQKNETLAQQILFIARSLGLAAYSKIKMSKSQKSELRPYHRIHISGDINRIPVRIARRKAGPRLQKKRVLVTGIKVEPIGDGEYFGFEVDGDHLYLLGDLQVTHNSLLMQQLCTAAVLGREWLGMRCAPGRALYIACEDDRDELWRRQAAINRQIGCDMADIGDAGLCLAPRVGQDNAMIRLDRASWSMKSTDLFRRVARYCREHGKQYVVFDTATQTFAGNQNDEMQVVAYIAELRRLAMAIEGVVILTKHPSMAGRALGTGESGNVAWNNSVRSRLYVMKDKQGFITLKTMKSNYAPSGGVVPLKWDRGVLVLDKPDQPPLSYGYDD